MKGNPVVSYVLAVLEGGIAGTCFFFAGKKKACKHKALWYAASAAWFALSLLNSTEGSRRLRARRAGAIDPD